MKRAQLSGANTNDFRAYAGSNICIAGDSIGEMQSNMNIAGGKVFFARGWVNWMQSFLGFPWEFEPEDNFAISGASFLSTLQQQIPVLLAAHTVKRYTRCFVSCGTNDTVNGATYDNFTLQQIKTHALAVFQTLRNAGIIPVYTGVPARGADADAQRYKAWAANLNEWFYQLGQSGLIEYVPRVQQVFADPNSPYGNSAAGMAYDNTHPSMPGGMLAGWELAEHFRLRGVGPNMRFATVANDVFDRTDNPTGSLFANPVLAGTAGSGATIAPTGYTTSIGTGSGAWSKVARALPNGTSRSDPRCTFGGAGVNMLISPNMLGPANGGWLADGSKLLPGDVIETRSKVVVAGASNLREVQLRLVESNGVAAAAHYGLNSQDTSLAMPMSDFTIYLKSPRVKVRDYGGSGQVLMYSRLEMTTIGTSAGTADVQAFEVRKVG
jgi:hypothetical protein